jgi:transposase InsO family protein
MSAEMTAQLVTDALVMAIWRRGKPAALLHHSDRGSQYPPHARRHSIAGRQAHAQDYALGTSAVL